MIDKRKLISRGSRSFPTHGRKNNFGKKSDTSWHWLREILTISCSNLPGLSRKKTIYRLGGVGEFF